MCTPAHIVFAVSVRLIASTNLLPWPASKLECRLPLRFDFHSIAREIVPNLSRTQCRGLFVIATIAGAAALTLISVRDFQRESRSPKNRPIRSQIAGYVTSNACRAYHPGNYASWHAS